MRGGGLWHQKNIYAIIFCTMAFKKPHRILIVEDDKYLLVGLREKLMREGFEILEARDGVEGLEVACREHPNLILLDIILPHMDGLTMLKKLRLDSWGKDVPVIILTNLSEGDKKAEAIESGVYDYLVKAHWKLRDVVKKVRERLGMQLK